MSQAPSQTAAHCPHCGAGQGAGRSSCWLCHAELPPQPKAGTTVEARPHPVESTPRGLSYSISTLLLATTLVAVCAALVAEIPGLGVPICILLAPVLVRTVMVVRRREAAGKHVSMGEKVALILTSFVVINVILAVVGVAAVGSFCAVCLGTVAVLNEGAIVAAGLTGITVTILFLVLMVRWVRARYRRDIS